MARCFCCLIWFASTFYFCCLFSCFCFVLQHVFILQRRRSCNGGNSSSPLFRAPSWRVLAKRPIGEFLLRPCLSGFVLGLSGERRPVYVTSPLIWCKLDRSGPEGLWKANVRRSWVCPRFDHPLATKATFTSIVGFLAGLRRRAKIRPATGPKRPLPPSRAERNIKKRHEGFIF